MLRPSRKIPKITVATLMVGGCGGGSSPTPTPAEIFADFCQYLRTCEPTVFDSYFSSASECVNYFESTVEYYTTYYGTRCANAFVDYYECLNDNALGPACSYSYAEVLNCRDPLAAACGF